MELKSSEGRRTTHMPKITEVEQIPCPAADGKNHLLTNTQTARTQCVYCTCSWAEIDAVTRNQKDTP